MKGADPYPLDWIDDYVAAIRDYVVVRQTDALLIKLPNEAFRLNRTGVRTLRHVLGGGLVADIWRAAGATAEARRDLYAFFVGVKQLLQGCADERRPAPGIAVRPFALGFSALPILSEVALTYRCNLRCAFCYAACGCVRGDGAREMSTAEATRVLEVIRRDAEVPSVSFTGGEPALRPDLESLVAYARGELGMRVNLITNGTLIDDARARRLAAAGLSSAQVSLEAPDAAAHEALTRAPGSFARTLAGIRALRGAGLHVHTNTTITRRTLEAVAGMPAFVRTLGLARLSMNVVIPAGSTRDEGRDLAVRYEELPTVLDRVRDEAARAGVEFMWYSPTPICIFNPIPRRLGNKGCSACDGLLSVSPAGDVLPCSSWAEPVGNLLTSPFADVWGSARSAMIRRKECAPAGCGSCDEFALCQGACPLYWSHFGTGELERYGARHVASAG